MTPAREVLVEEAGGIITVTLDREAKRNAISRLITEALWRAVTRLGDEDDLRCLVITARGSYFSAGIDLEDGVGNRRGDASATARQPGWAYRRNYRSHHLLYDEIEAVEKPVVLAAQGPVLGAGVELAVSCDFRFCTPRTTWRLPEVALGALAGSGGTSRLARLVGPHWAKWMAMAGQPVDALQAVTIGLVHGVFEEGMFLDQVNAFCREVLAHPAEAVGLAKVVVDLATDTHDRNVQRQVDRIANSSLRVGSNVFEERTRRFREATGQAGTEE